MSENEAEQKLTTLYVNNLNEKITLNKTKYVLAKLFGRYGTVVGITAHKNLKMKGQAFVTYKEHISCQKAISKLEGRPVFKKPIHIVYAQNPSDHERELKGDLEAISQRKEQKKVRVEAEEKAKKEESDTDSKSAPAQLSKAQIKQWKSLPPNNVLLLQNVDESKLETQFLETQFKAFAGFSKVRLIKFRKLAFIDFDSESSATACMDKIDHEQFGASSLLSYAKK